MLRQIKKFLAVYVVIAGGLSTAPAANAQDAPPPGNSQAPPDEPQPMPKGVEVLARGPIHEAFATPTTEPQPTRPISKKPPKPIDELPPAEKPEGDVVWISGYWAWDDEREDFLWVSGIWRTAPPNKHWVAGYWKDNGDQWQWVPGFWMANARPAQDGTGAGQEAQEVTYFPKPPEPPETAPPPKPPVEDIFYVPGVWVWADGRYAWRAGYWARVQPGYVWVAAHYRWTPSGYIFIPGYWDYAVSRRGVLYAPVYIDRGVVGVNFVFTPAYAVRDTIILDSLFVRPAYCHYYFGDYYGPVYRRYGFESCIIYSRRRYDPIFVYERWDRRHEPRWEGMYLEVTLARHAGRAPLPPRTLAQQRTIIEQNVTNVTVINKTTVNNHQVLMPASQLAATRGTRTVPLDTASRQQARIQAQSIQQVAQQRRQMETAAPQGGPGARPRSASFQVPKPQPVASSPSSSSRPPENRGAGFGRPPASTGSQAQGGIPPSASSPARGAPAGQNPATANPSSGQPARAKGPNTPGNTPMRPLGKPDAPSAGNGSLIKDAPPPEAGPVAVDVNPSASPNGNPPGQKPSASAGSRPIPGAGGGPFGQRPPPSSQPGKPAPKPQFPPGGKSSKPDQNRGKDKKP